MLELMNSSVVHLSVSEQKKRGLSMCACSLHSRSFFLRSVAVHVERSCSLSLYFAPSHPFLSLSLSFFSFSCFLFVPSLLTLGRQCMREKIACWSVRLQCCALCRLSCVVDVLLTFLSYGFKEKKKGERKDTTENQTPSTELNRHVSKDNC